MSKTLPTIPTISENAGNVYKALETLYITTCTLFASTFRFEKTTRMNYFQEQKLFCETSILEKRKNYLKSYFRIWPLQIESKTFFVATDLFSSKNFYRVFPIYPDESDVMAKHIRTHRNERVLDLCTGSGIYAIAARSQGAKVTASDINNRCLKMGKFNERLNELSGIHWMKGDLFRKFKNKKFDYIICDPPFMPVPEFKKNKSTASYYLHGAAGQDGLYFINKIIQDLPLYLTEYGRFSLFVNVLGKKGELPLQTNLVSSFLERGKHLNLTYTQVLPELNILSSYAKQYRSSRNLSSWENMLSERFDSFQLYIIDGTISPSSKIRRKNISLSLPLDIREEAGKPPKQFAHDVYTNPWQYRLARFFHKIA